MSLILEALKKAQRDRECQTVSGKPIPQDAPLVASRPLRTWVVIAGAVALFASGGALTWWWGQAVGPAPAPLSRPAPAPQAAEPGPTPAIASPGPSPDVPVREAKDHLRPPSNRPEPPAKSKAKGASAAGGAAERPASPTRARPSGSAASPVPPGPAQNPAVTLPASPPPAAPAAAIRKPGDAPVLAPPPVSMQAGAPAAGPPTAPRLEAVPAAPSTPAQGSSDVDTTPALPSSASLAAVVPTLTLNAHMYSANKTERVVYIDGRRYVEGERVKGLYLLEEITPQGVILSYQGERELLSLK